ncbi:MAG: hypothetical protein ACI86M_001309 [Saprospiraceae bacterium]|jgi:hypothetical protein
MNIPCAWTITNGSPYIAVAVGDLYMDGNHTDLTGKVVEIVGDCNPPQGEWHHGNQSLGAVAGIRNNGHCIAGSGGETKVAAFCGNYSTSNAILLDMMNRGYKIVSVSRWGGLTKARLELLTSNGVVVLIAALNQDHQADDPDGYHSVPGVIHCGRANNAGDFWQYNSGTNTDPNMNMDVLAMTQGIHRLQPGDSCSVSSTGGTSIGTPHIAGVVALMMDVNPCLTPSDYEEILVATSQAVPANAPVGTTRGGIIDAYAAVLMAQNFQGVDKIYSGSQTISMDQISGNLTIQAGAQITIEGKIVVASNKDITVEAGATLEVTGTIELGEDTRIIVKRGATMVVNGGTITNAKGPNSCYESDQWEAIIVEGNASQPQQGPKSLTIDLNKNGILHLKSATIENGHTMISMSPDHLPYNDRPAYWGGHVTAIGTIFRNTNSFSNYARVAQFMQYFQEDKSSFVDCSISNVAAGMTHWSNFGVTYDHNRFDTYDKHAILTYDASIIVQNGNEFENSLITQFDEAAIDLEQTFPIENGSVIGGEDLNLMPNQFYGGYNSIFSEGGVATNIPMLIQNNNFVGGNLNVYFKGISTFNLSRNDFIGPIHGTTLSASGDRHNIQRDNQFSSNDVGIFTFYDNSGYEFLSNCFDFTDDIDVRIDGGTIRENQGNGTVAASNVFSNNTDTRRIAMSGLPNNPPDPYFTYWIEENTPTADRTVPWVGFSVPVDNDSDEYNLFDANLYSNDICGATNSAGSVNTADYDCDLPADCDELPQFIADLEIELAQEIAVLQSLPQFSAQWYQTKYTIAEIHTCIQEAKIKLIFCKGKKQETHEIIPYFQNGEFQYRTYVLGSMLSNQDYTSARTYLNGINAVTEEDVDFVATQDINIDRLADYSYVPSPTDLNTLHTIGMKTYPMSAYARALYRYLTGDKIDLPLPYGSHDINPREVQEDAFIERYNFFPNPTDHMVTIDYSIQENRSMSVYDMQGNEIMSYDLDGTVDKASIDLGDQSNGIYLILIRDTKTHELVHSEKIILMK